MMSKIQRRRKQTATLLSVLLAVTLVVPATGAQGAQGDGAPVVPTKGSPVQVLGSSDASEWNAPTFDASELSTPEAEAFEIEASTPESDAKLDAANGEVPESDAPESRDSVALEAPAEGTLAPLAVTSGQCGDNLAWTFDDATGELAVSGTGPMWDFGTDTGRTVPWKGFANAITSVSVGDGVTSIGAYSFGGLKNMTRFELGGDIASIGQYAFYMDKALTGVNLPASLREIGDAAFNSAGLASLVVPEGVTRIGEYAFSSSKNLASATLPDSLLELGKSAFYYCNALLEITLPGSLTTIGDLAFSNCASLKKAVFSPGVTAVGDEMFSDCTALTDVDLGTVEVVGYKAFWRCSSLSSARFSDFIVEIEGSAFAGCSSLSTVKLPDTLERIRSRAFNGCNLGPSLTIPSRVSFIGQFAFDENPGLVNMVFENYDALELVQWNSVFYTIPSFRMAVEASLGEGFGEFDMLPPSSWDGATDGTRFESTETGRNDGASGSWVRKSASWLDSDKTQAEVVLDASYAQRKSVDYVFVMDSSTSMQNSVAVTNNYAPWYNLLYLYKGAVKTLLNEPGYDNRIAVASFGDMKSTSVTTQELSGSDSGFLGSDDEAVVQSWISAPSTFRGTGWIDKDLGDGFELAQSIVEGRADTSRPVVVIYGSDCLYGGLYNDPDRYLWDGIIESKALREQTGAAVYGAYIGGWLDPGDPYAVKGPERMKLITDDYLVFDGEGDLAGKFAEMMENAAYDPGARLTDTVDPRFELQEDSVTVTDGAGAVVPDAATVTTAADGTQSIAWDLSKVGNEAHQKLTAHLKLKPNASGGYDEGLFEVGGQTRVLTSTGQVVNTVASPVLGRNVPRSLSVSMDVVGSIADEAASYSVEITLSANDGTPHGNMSFPYVASDGSPSALTSDGNGKVTLSLLKGQRGTIENIPEGSLVSITESPGTLTAQHAVDGGSFADGANVQVTMDRDRSVAFKNSGATARFSFMKVDAQNHAVKLSGARFLLYRVIDGSVPNPGRPGEGSHWGAPIEATSDASGLVDFGLLPKGSYGLVEASAPDGYNTPSGWWTVSVDPGKPQSPVVVSTPDAATVPAFARLTDGSLAVPNMRILVPPFTGGSGALVFIVGGAAAVAVALLLRSGRRGGAHGGRRD